MFINDWKKELFTIPNLLSLFRLVLIPVYMTMYLQGRHLLAGIILALSCLTDFFDGWVARRFHMTTSLGKLLDPAADKATQLTLILCLSVRYEAMVPVLILFLIKEACQLAALFFCLCRRVMPVRTLMAGKICTAILFASLVILVLFPGIPVRIVRGLAAVDLAALGLSFICYGLNLIRHGQEFTP